jgi:hypothetical protein
MLWTFIQACPTACWTLRPSSPWRTAEHLTLWNCLSLQMGTVFVKVGDHANYERLCRLLFALDPGNTSIVAKERHSKACFLGVGDLPPDLQQRGLELARLAVDKRTQVGAPRWMCHTGGMAEYHAGKFERALELLLEAEGSEDLSCKGGAMVYRAMTLKRLGREAASAQVLRAAEELLAGPLKRRLDPYWWDLDICQLALDEARQLFGQAAKH